MAAAAQAKPHHAFSIFFAESAGGAAHDAAKAWTVLRRATDEWRQPNWCIAHAKHQFGWWNEEGATRGGVTCITTYAARTFAVRDATPFAR